MLMDAIRGYIQIASGLTDATSEKAKEVAQALLSVAGMANPSEVAGQVSGMADEVMSTAKAQRANLLALVRAEVTTVVDSSGLAKTADLDAIKARLAKLASEVEQLVRELPGAQARDDAARFVEEHTPAALTAASMRARVRPGKKSSAAPAKSAAKGTSTRKSATAAGGAKKTAATRKAATPRKTAAAKKATTAKKTTAKKTASAPADTE
jgi:polyhydroxyalkanoate synthesis regulator phasin